jgi:FkbM family methyltransferase
MKKALTTFILLLSRIIGKKNLENLLIFSAKTINVNLYIHGIIQNGGMSSYNQQINGEEIFVEKILPGILKTEKKLVLFDVGANIGDFSLELRRFFPTAEIYVFEPVKTTFDVLTATTNEHEIKLHNIGFSDKTGTGELFNTINKSNNTIASAYKDVFAEVFEIEDELRVIEFTMDTIDNFCHLNNITNIDFLKIDVEGHELSVIRGASNLLLTDSIKIIQFEFNAHNIYSRVFLRDFYLTLPQFEFYRIVQNGLIALGPYTHLNEIFNLQNIVAVRKEFRHLIKESFLNPS